MFHHATQSESIGTIGFREKEQPMCGVVIVWGVHNHRAEDIEYSHEYGHREEIIHRINGFDVFEFVEGFHMEI